MRSEELQRLMNEFKEWDWVNDNEKLFHEDTVYEMLLHLQHRFKQKLNIHSVSVSLPHDNFCKVCNMPTDGEKCYSKRCPV